jgi:osmotically-inducible protein OsmY
MNPLSQRATYAPFLRIIAAMALCTQLSACVGLMVAGAAGGALVVSDRRSSEMQVDDKQIEFRLSGALNERYEHTHINLSSYNRAVLLTGEVPDAATGKAVEALAMKIEGVKAVVNELGVGANSTLAARTQDATITSKVKTALFEDKLTHANAFRVTTERGTVYLQGRVTRLEGDRAAGLARSVSGVVKVVKVLDYLTDADLKRLSN